MTFQLIPLQGVHELKVQMVLGKPKKLYNPRAQTQSNNTFAELFTLQNNRMKAHNSTTIIMYYLCFTTFITRTSVYFKQRFRRRSEGGGGGTVFCCVCVNKKKKRGHGLSCWVAKQESVTAKHLNTAKQVYFFSAEVALLDQWPRFRLFFFRKRLWKWEKFWKTQVPPFKEPLIKNVHWLITNRLTHWLPIVFRAYCPMSQSMITRVEVHSI